MPIKVDETCRSTMFFIIYQITNLITNEKYVGQHKTSNLDDKYMGSGKIIKKKIAEYGIENFKKEILCYCKSQEEMNIKEIFFISKLKPEYNLHPGGTSFKFINRNKLHYSKKQQEERKIRWQRGGVKAFKKKFYNDSNFRENNRKNLIKATEMRMKKFPNGVWYGRKHSDETKKKMSESKRGKTTISTLGKHWFTNGQDNVLSFECPEGWKTGRIIVKK